MFEEFELSLSLHTICDRPSDTTNILMMVVGLWEASFGIGGRVSPAGECTLTPVVPELEERRGGTESRVALIRRFYG